MRKSDSYSRSWKKARRNGARAERALATTLKNRCADPTILARLGEASSLSGVKVVGGRLVMSSVAAGRVPPKADIIALASGRELGISVKASPESRLALHTVSNVCAALEAFYDYPPDDCSRTSMELLVGGPQVTRFYRNNARFHPTTRQNTMGGFDQRMYRPDELSALLLWLHHGMPFLADFLFGRGLGESGAASHLWYYAPSRGLDQVCEVASIVEACKTAPAPAVTGEGGGMGIKLPFGGLETAKGRLVFRHSYRDLCALGVPFR